MLFKFTSSHTLDIYSKRFYNFSSIANLISSIFAVFIIPPFASSISIFGVCLFLGFLIEALMKKTFTVDQYNDRYTLKIFYEMIITTIAMVLINESYLLYLPILLSMLYLNVNAIIKSKLIQYSAFAFMLTPLYKIFSLPSDQILVYISVCVLFMLLAFLSTFLFKAHQEIAESAEKREDIMKEVYKLIQRKSIHNVRNELTRLYLSANKYQDNYPEFLEIMKSCSENIQKYANTYAFDNDECITLESIFNDLENYMHSPNITCFNSILDRKVIIGNRNFIYSLIKTILEYCQEKALYNNLMADVNIIKRENSLIIRDECGHKESKEFEKFLSVMDDEDVKRIFKFDLKCLETSLGNEFVINFRKV